MGKFLQERLDFDVFVNGYLVWKIALLGIALMVQKSGEPPGNLSNPCKSSREKLLLPTVERISEPSTRSPRTILPLKSGSPRKANRQSMKQRQYEGFQVPRTRAIYINTNGNSTNTAQHWPLPKKNSRKPPLRMICVLNDSLICHQLDIYIYTCICYSLAFFLAIVTTGTITFLIGGSYKPSLLGHIFK